jgi:hypothetical protein
MSVVTAIASAAAVVFIDLAWNHRAAHTCNQEAEKQARERPKSNVVATSRLGLAAVVDSGA